MGEAKAPLKANILVVNDDGPKSPLLAPFLSAISAAPWCKSLTWAVPATNQSWKGFAMTRHGIVSATPGEIAGHPGYLVGGTPADCAALGIYHFLPEPPDYVLAGINLGINSTMPYFLASATIGAAAVSTLCRVRACALSADIPWSMLADFDSADYDKFASRTADWARIAEQCVALVGRLMSVDGWRFADLYSINVPLNVQSDTPTVFTKLQRGSFRTLFKPVGPGKFEHDSGPLEDGGLRAAEPQNLPYTVDAHAIKAGHTSITPVAFALGAELPADAMRVVTGAPGK